MSLIDTHCHIHEADYPLAVKDVLSQARQAGVEQMICVGTDIGSSKRAVEFAAKHKGVYASIGIHPHNTEGESQEFAHQLDSIYHHNGFAPGLTGAPAPGQTRAADVFGGKRDQSDRAVIKRVTRGGVAPPEPNEVSEGGADRAAGPAISDLRSEAYDGSDSSIMAIGEIGLDYYYNHSPREVQIKAFEEQIELAIKLDLPIIFHVREAFDDFWPILNNFGGKLRGVLHSFTDNAKNAEEGLSRGLYIGLNGISVFTKDEAQKQLFTNLPLDRILLETDSPFLTPPPFRGQVNQPAYAKSIAEHQAIIRGVSFDEVAKTTTSNARQLFGL